MKQSLSMEQRQNNTNYGCIDRRKVRAWLMKHFACSRKHGLTFLMSLSLFMLFSAILSFRSIEPLLTNEPVLPVWLKSTHAITHFKQLPWTQGNDSLLVVFPHCSIDEVNKTLWEINKNDMRALWKLSEFLDSQKQFDGATCLRLPSTHIRHDEKWKKINEKWRKKHGQNNTVTRNILESSWCQFNKRNWSLNIRNIGPVQKVKLSNLDINRHIAEVIVLQSCNILQGPFVIRKKLFDRIGGLLENFGKVTLLEFFLRSKGELKMAKLTNCAWTHEITHTDRGTLEGAKFSEYALFGNKHQILRIVTESRIEWTTCVANWKLCPEKPYVKPRNLPRIAEPICCSAVLGQMLADFKWVLEKLGLQYRIIYGTLLGAVRSQAIIPWTHDVDIAISKSAILNESTFTAFRKELGGQYYVGDSFAGTLARGHMLKPPYIEVDTAPFYDGPDDLEGNALFSNEIEEAVGGMLPVSDDWREHCYVDFYEGEPAWMNDSSIVTINNQTFFTVKQVDYELTNWYGANYSKPALQGIWTGRG